MTTEATTTTAETTTTTAATTATDAWHKGVDAEILGHWNNKGFDLADPAKIAIEMTKQHRAAEKHLGVPADQLLKMPKADAKPEDVRAFWNRLGAPAEAKDYDFSGVKDGAGQPISAALADAIRNAAHSSYLPKDAAAKVADSVVKALDSAKAAETAIATAKLAEEKATLDKNWGANKDFNLLKAMEGARRLGITPEAVKAMEGQIGYAAVMEAMRKIGSGTSEDTFVERGVGNSGQVTTQAGAKARLDELMADASWAKRLTSGDAQATTEWRALTIMIDGEAA